MITDTNTIINGSQLRTIFTKSEAFESTNGDIAFALNYLTIKSIYFL